MTNRSDAQSTQSTESPTKPIRLTDRTELVDLLDADSPVLIEFYTKGCTLCQSIEPVLGNVARATGITVGMINPQFDLDVVDEYRITSVPTLIVFENGDEVGRLADGFQGTDAVIEFLATHLGDEAIESTTTAD